MEPVEQSVEPKLEKQISPEEMKESIQKLLQDDKSNEEISNWLEKNVGEMSPPMYRALVTVICESAITGTGTRREVNLLKLKNRICILARYVQVNQNLELSALLALQHLMNKLGHPKGILLQICDMAYNEDYLSEDGFKQWEKLNDPAEQEGKEAAMDSISSFYKWLKEDEESADSD